MLLGKHLMFMYRIVIDGLIVPMSLWLTSEFSADFINNKHIFWVFYCWL